MRIFLQKSFFVYYLNMYKKIIFLLLPVSLFVFISEAFALENTTTNSPFFITNPFRDPPKTSETTAPVRKKLPKKPFNILDSYTVVSTGSAITLYKHHTSQLYIEKIDLAKWASLRSLADATEWDSVTGEPLFPKMNISETLEKISDSPFTLINGQFFDPTRNPTPLSFGLKVDGEIKTAGADNGDTQKNILSIWDSSAQILPYSWENLRDATGNLVLVSFSTRQKHHRDEEIGRTYICLAHPDTHNSSSELIILVAQSMSEVFAEKELIRWGCTATSTAKLDSSGSSRIWYSGTTVYGNSHHGDPDGRRIPHMIAIYDAP